MDRPWQAASLDVGSIQRNRHNGSLTSSFLSFYKVHVPVQFLPGEPPRLENECSRYEPPFVLPNFPICLFKANSASKTNAFWTWHVLLFKVLREERDVITGIMSKLVFNQKRVDCEFHQKAKAINLLGISCSSLTFLEPSGTGRGCGVPAREPGQETNWIVWII